MSLRVFNDDITTVTSGFICHGVNCSGAFGSGVAGAIKKKWPVVYKTFKSIEPSPKLLGAFHPILIDGKLVIGNCYTQEKYGNDGKKYASIDAVALSLKTAYLYAIENNLKTISMPKIGCGLGGLDWDDEVLPIVNYLDEQYYNNIETHIYWI
jgi:O-acetyl-ADP-ribose deacetylase (regulator of RNase III)